MSGSVFTSSQFGAFAKAIRQRESTDNYLKVNAGGDLGAYQMSPAALRDIGFLDKKNHWTILANNLGVNSSSDFLSNSTAQDIAFQRYTQKDWEYLHDYRHYIGQTIDGILITEAGILAGAHLVGAKDIKKFLDTNGQDIAHDGNQVTVTEYLKKFSDFHFSFPSTTAGFSPAVNTAPHTASGNSPAPAAIKTQPPAPAKPVAGHSAENSSPSNYDNLPYGGLSAEALAHYRRVRDTVASPAAQSLSGLGPHGPTGTKDDPIYIYQISRPGA